MATLTSSQAVPHIQERRSDVRRTLSNALIITQREVRDSFRDWRILAPIVILTFCFPFLAQFVAGKFATFVEGYGAQIVGERTIPFLLMIVGFFPISISLVIALETFVGEKERRSLEPLLSTPLTNTELYIGKTLAAMIPPLVSSMGGMTVYLMSLVFGELGWRPEPMLVVQIVLLTVVQALVMVTGAVVVSSQTTSTRAANLLASFIIIPMTLIIQGESAIMFLAPDAESPSGISSLWLIMVAMIVVVLLLLRVGNAIFNREELLGRTIDQLNLKGTFKKIWRHIRAVDDAGTPAPNMKQWYLRSIPLSMGRIRSASYVVIIVFVAAFVGGLIIGLQPEWRLPYLRDAANVGDLGSGMELGQRMDLIRSSGPGWIVVNNARILLGAALLGLFTFGSAALVLTPLAYFVLGFILAQFLGVGLDASFLIPAVLTHGVIEIPTIIIAAAAAVRIGAVVTRPPEGSGVGHAWTIALADLVKLWIGVILPGLVLAALIEAYITPVVVKLFFGA